MSAESPSTEPATSPQIGVDEWVRRSGERTAGPGGLLRLANRTPSIVVLAAFIGIACAIPELSSSGYVIGVDADTLLYEFTVNDPNFTKPWTAGLPFAKINGPIFEFGCHEGNYGLANILSGARADEKKAAAAAAKKAQD